MLISDSRMENSSLKIQILLFECEMSYLKRFSVSPIVSSIASVFLSSNCFICSRSWRIVTSEKSILLFSSKIRYLFSKQFYLQNKYSLFSKLLFFAKMSCFFVFLKSLIFVFEKSNLHFPPPWFFRSANSACKSVTVCRKVSASSKAFFAFSASNFHATACWRTERGSGKLRGKNRTDFGKSIKYRNHAT